MAVVGTLAYRDDTGPGWKIAWGAADKPTFVIVYPVDGEPVVCEPPTIDGRTNVAAVEAFLAEHGVVLTQDVKNVIGA